MSLRYDLMDLPLLVSSRSHYIFFLTYFLQLRCLGGPSSATVFRGLAACNRTSSNFGPSTFILILAPGAGDDESSVNMERLTIALIAYRET